MKHCTLLAILLSGLLSAAVETDFSYADQGAWQTLPNSQCGGRRQSPVDLDLRNVTVDKILGQDLACTWQQNKAVIEGDLVNTGRTIELDVRSPHTCRGVPGSPSAHFRLAAVHIHYGSASDQGSEHTINGRTSALEVHMVHFDTRFASLDKAREQPGGIMVAGLLFDEADEAIANPELTKMAVISGTALRSTGGVLASRLNAAPLIEGTGLDKARARFLTYAGSLTTPTCNEVVTWIVAAEPGLVGHQTMHLLRTVTGLGNKTISPNFRQVQPLNGRTITSSFQPACGLHGRC
ncbi:unnamed protein product (mitochondrion) [Plasmodiophora brassicae]|uniref:carbonic anhydrase n=1 Tax=Plasmodiophora brassicae TaxID=37360 RepID=A0A0G4IPN5_PLABS|nr:hypothetical protein PBRA_000525 [Plasmodiophora brassicae]SPQ97498.1 unnamed protein product [Plasmodiophora brassicae]